MLSDAEELQHIKETESCYQDSMLFKSCRIADLSDEDKLAFHKYMKALAQDLLGNTYDLDSKNIVFLLSNRSEANAAFVHEDSNHLYVYVTAALFEQCCSNKDQLGFILGHELGHFDEYQKHGEHLNHKGEEGISDIAAIDKMVQAGLNIEEAYTIAKKLFSSFGSSLRALRDEHQLDSIRVSQLSDKIVATREAVREDASIPKSKRDQITAIPGSESAPEGIPHPIDDNIWEVIHKAAKQKLSLEEYFESDEFQNLPDDQKVDIYFEKIEESLICLGSEYEIKQPDGDVLKNITLPFDSQDYAIDGKSCNLIMLLFSKAMKSIFEIANMPSTTLEDKMSLMSSKTEALDKILRLSYSSDALEKNSDILESLIRKEFANFRESTAPDTDLFIRKANCLKHITSFYMFLKHISPFLFGLDNAQSDIGKHFSDDVLWHEDEHKPVLMDEPSEKHRDLGGIPDETLELENGSVAISNSNGMHLIDANGKVIAFSSDRRQFRAQVLAAQINETIRIINDIKAGKQVDPKKKLKALMTAWFIQSPEITSKGGLLYTENIKAMGLQNFVARDNLLELLPLPEKDLISYLSKDAKAFYLEKNKYPRTEGRYTAFIKSALRQELADIHDNDDSDREKIFLRFCSSLIEQDHLYGDENYLFHTHPERHLNLIKTYTDLFGTEHLTSDEYDWFQIVEDARLRQYFNKHHTVEGFEPTLTHLIQNMYREIPYRIFNNKDNYTLSYASQYPIPSFLGSTLSIDDPAYMAAKEKCKRDIQKASRWDPDNEDTLVKDFHATLTHWYDNKAYLYQYAALDFYRKASIQNKINYMAEALGATISHGEDAETVKKFRQKCGALFKADFENPEISIADKVKLFTALANANLFDTEYKNYFEILTGKNGKGGILKDLENYSGEKAELYLNLTAAGHRIVDPEIRERLVQQAARYWIKENGQYDDTKANQTEREDFIKKIEQLKTLYVKNMPYDDAYALLKQIAATTLSQEQLSKAIAPEKFVLDAQNSTTIAAAYSLDTLHFLSDEGVITSEQMQDLLLGSSAPEDIAKKCAAIKKSLLEHIESVKKAGTPYWSTSFKDMTRLDALNFIDNLLTPQHLMQVKKEFDMAPLTMKTVIVQMLMNESSWEEQFNTVSNRLFPGNTNEEKIGKQFLHSYLASRADSEKSLYLSAIYVAAQTKMSMAEDSRGPYTASQRSLAVGMRLFLENSGPAGTKLAQAMASYPDVPNYIREEMQKAKSQANPPARWEVFEWLEKAGQMDLLQHGQLGKLLGSASFFVTFDLLDKSQKGKVVKILRSGSEDKAQAEFEIYKTTLGKVAQSDTPQGAPKLDGIESFKRLIDNAADMVQVETNLEIGEKQLRDAQTLYPSSVSVDGTNFNLQVMDWSARSDTWAVMDKAHGKDFKDLEESYKKKAAKAVLTTELANMLSGNRFDSDRHAGQYKFDDQTHTIGIFDTGSMSIVPATQKDRYILGKVLANTVSTLMKSKGRTIGDIFSSELDKGIKKYYAEEIQNGKPLPPYLSEFQRGLLALSDFYSELNATEMMDTLIQAFNNGKNKLDPHIYQGFKEGLKSSGKSLSLTKKIAMASLAILGLESHDDILTPEAKQAQEIGHIVAKLAITQDSFHDTLTTVPSALKDNGLSLASLTSTNGGIQFAKGMMREIVPTINPSQYPPEERREVGAILYKVIEEGTKRSKSHQPFDGVALFREQLANLSNTGKEPSKYAKNLERIIALSSTTTSIMGINTSLNKFKMMVGLGRLIDPEVKKGYSQALHHRHLGSIRSILEQVHMNSDTPKSGSHQAIKETIRTVVREIAPQCLRWIMKLSPQQKAKSVQNKPSRDDY